MRTEPSKIIVFFHADCADGSLSAYLMEDMLPHAELRPSVYGKENTAGVDGADVYFVDFSAPLEVMQDIADRAHSLTVIDHHKTAEEALKSLPSMASRATVIFDMKRSGAGLTWDYLHPKTPRPWYVDYVEDRDLWNWRLPESKGINAYLFDVVPMTPKGWGEWVSKDVTFNQAVEFGAMALQRQKLEVQRQLRNARKVMFDGYESVPCVNLTTMASEVLHELCHDAPFAIGWFRRADGDFVYSLRSADTYQCGAGRIADGADVSAIAKAHGGGGHKHAAGFSSKTLLF